MDFWIKP